MNYSNIILDNEDFNDDDFLYTDSENLLDRSYTIPWFYDEVVKSSEVIMPYLLEWKRQTRKIPGEEAFFEALDRYRLDVVDMVAEEVLTPEDYNTGNEWK